MENTGIINNNNNSFATTIVTKEPQQTPEALIQKVAGLNKTSENNIDRDQDQARFEAVKQASQSLLNKLPFSALNARFTIYRDTNSESLAYVTRFTNINSGEVKIIREPELLTISNPNNGSVLNGLV